MLLLIVTAGGVLVAGAVALLVVRRRRAPPPASAFLWVELYYRPTPHTSGWLPIHVLLPWGVAEDVIDSTALTLAAAQLHHAGHQVAELRVQYIGGQRCARPYIGPR